MRFCNGGCELADCDDMTGQHTQRVGEMSGLIAEQLGLPIWHVELIRLAAPHTILENLDPE